MGCRRDTVSYYVLPDGTITADKDIAINYRDNP